MGNNVTPIVEGGLLVAISVVLGLSATYLPIVGIAVEFFCAVPFVFLTVRQGAGKGLTALTVSFFLLSMFMGPLLAARLAFTINICGVILGWCITKNFNTVKCFLATFISSIAAQVIAIAFVLFAMGINFTETEISMLKESFEQSFEFYESMGVDQTQLDEMKKQVAPVLESMSFLMPIIIILVALVNTIACYLTAKWIFPKLQLKFIEPLPPFKEWRFPKFFLYVAAFSILGLYWGVTRQWNALHVVSVNALFLAMGIGLIQGLAVFSFAADRYKLSKLLRRLIFALIILNMMFTQIAALVGLFDMIFDYRKKLFS